MELGRNLKGTWEDIGPRRKCKVGRFCKKKLVWKLESKLERTAERNLEVY